MCSNPNAESFKVALEKFQGLFFLFEEFKNILRDEEVNPMKAYWMTFLGMTEVLLDYVKSICVGDWELHLAASERMLSWLHAYDRQNYSPHFSYHSCRQKLIETPILQSTKLSSRKVSQQKEWYGSLIYYHRTRLSSKQSINNKKDQEAKAVTAPRLELFKDGLSRATL